MQDDAFENWLRNIDSRPIAQIRDNLSRARRVEREMRLNLDTEYHKDRCEMILNLLNIDNPSVLSSKLPYEMTGLSSLKTAIRKYVKFSDWQQNLC